MILVYRTCGTAYFTSRYICFSLLSNKITFFPSFCAIFAICPVVHTLISKWFVTKWGKFETLELKTNSNDRESSKVFSTAPHVATGIEDSTGIEVSSIA